MGRKLKKTLIFEFCASILVVALLAGLNALMGKSSELDRELALLSLNSHDVAVNAHRRHHGHRQGHARRHHERSPSRVSDRRPAGHHPQRTQPQPTGGNTPAAANAAPTTQPAPAAPPAEPPRVQ